MKNFYQLTLVEIFKTLFSNEGGLTTEEAKKRLKENGPNKLPEVKMDSWFLIFIRQFQSPLIYILFIAMGAVFLLGEMFDALIIFLVVFFNAIVGSIQEGKAQNVLLALKKFTETSASVLRDGKDVVILDTEIVVGDILVLQEGEKVPADARIIFTNELMIDEASLTGESEPVTKNNTDGFSADLSISEQKNMVFKGTNVLGGNGLAVVVGTGINTEIGKIAEKIVAIDTEVPLKNNIRYLSRLIIIIIVIISVLLIFLGVLAGKTIQEMFITSVALSVSVIPEGLPIVMTLVLAIGVKRMSKHNVLVKRLQAVEALGQTRVVAVDKTGTLTKNEMVVQRVYVAGKTFEITGSGYEPTGEVTLDGQVIDSLNHPELLFSGKLSAFCANARLSFLEETKTWKVAGDPTEAAMLVFSEKIGFKPYTLEKEMPKIFELPFNYQKKYHATIRVVDNKNFLTVVGAPEKVLELCKNIWSPDGIHLIKEADKKRLEAEFHKLARSGFRVVAYAINPNTVPRLEAGVEAKLTFVGFLGINDALRPEVKEAVQRVKDAGMKVVMITGDYRLTAQAIAKEAGIWGEGDCILTGEEIDLLSDGELIEKLASTSVYARVTPEHKFRIVQVYRQQGEVIAMTGDGVNDAPSLVAADLGVAMGKIGTEVAKEASDIVLLDDNFANIVLAAEEGRGIYKTIKKVILYLFSTSLAEVLVITVAVFLEYPLPLLAAQIIWLNFVTDGFLDVALAMEPKESGLMRGVFKRPKKWIVDELMAQRMFFMSITMAIGTLYIFKQYFEIDLPKALTFSLTTLAMFQWFNTWNCRSESKSIFQQNPFSNKFLLLAMVIVVFLQMMALYTPFLQKILHTVPLSFSEWLIIIPIAGTIILVEEIRKLFYRQWLKKHSLKT